MFPLGVAHLPGDPGVLRVFEPRYVTMVRDLLAGDELCFGSVLITAGSEVGGGDRRARHGVLVRVSQMAATDEGGYAMVGLATEPFRVEEWLPDDPYPRARVTEIQAGSTSSSATSKSGPERSRMVLLAQNIRILLERVSLELGNEGVFPGPSREVLHAVRSIASGSDPSEVPGLGLGQTGRSRTEDALWLLARAVPCGPLDRLSVLAAGDVGSRLTAIEAVVDHVREVFDFGLERPED